MRIRSTLFLATALVFAPLAAFAASPSFTATGGIAALYGNGTAPDLGEVMPPSPARLKIDDNDVAFTASFAWNINDAWALEAWMTWPSQRNINIDLGNDQHVLAASYDVRPVMLSMQYQFPKMAQRYRPFAGVGWQWTRTSNEAVAPGQEQLQPFQVHGDDGLAAVAGVDIDVGNNWIVRGDVRFLDSSVATTTGNRPDVTMKNSANTMVYGASVGYRF
jgi:outer membrane protein W